VPSSVKDLIRKETYSDKWRKVIRSLDAHVDSNLNGETEINRAILAYYRHERIVEDDDRAMGKNL
jgi:hypothetical protein